MPEKHRFEVALVVINVLVVALLGVVGTYALGIDARGERNLERIHAQDIKITEMQTQQKNDAGNLATIINQLNRFDSRLDDLEAVVEREHNGRRRPARR